MKLRDAAPTSRVMVVAIMVSMVAFLDSTVANLALPAIKRDLGGGLATSDKCGYSGVRNQFPHPSFGFGQFGSKRLSNTYVPAWLKRTQGAA